MKYRSRFARTAEHALLLRRGGLGVVGTRLLRGGEPDRVDAERRFPRVEAEGLPAGLRETNGDRRDVAALVRIAPHPSVARLVHESVEEPPLETAGLTLIGPGRLGHLGLSEVEDDGVVLDPVRLGQALAPDPDVVGLPRLRVQREDDAGRLLQRA